MKLEMKQRGMNVKRTEQFYLSLNVFSSTWWSEKQVFMARSKRRCNTPFPEYVLSCVFRFSDRIFRFTFCIYSELWIPYMIVLSWIRIHGLVVRPSLNREPNPSILFDLVFPVFWFDRFQFQILFSNILDLLWFSRFFWN